MSARWFPATVGENRLEAFLRVYEEEVRDRLERQVGWAPEGGGDLGTHLEIVASQLRTGTYAIGEGCLPSTLMRLGAPRTHTGLNAWLRQDDQDEER